ncbi:MAG: pilus assembly protein TadG-related protein [Acidimicrobiales bacterium]
MSDDRGAVAIVMALCLVIITVIAALVIDGSRLYQERAELQNGADAAALAIARDCVEGACGAVYTTAEAYADPNANDGASRVPGGGITFPGTNTVRVLVSTDDAGANIDGDTTTVDYTFARVVGLDGKEVSAVAVASWGSVGSGSSIPLTASLCEFNTATANGSNFASGPPFSGAPVVISFHSGGPQDPTSPCPAGPAGKDIPGGFGWLDIDSPCQAVIDENNFVGANPGNGNPGNGSIDCTQADFLGPGLSGQTVLLPIYNDVTGTGQPASYRIEGFAAFHITGIRFPGGPSWRINMSTAECKNNQSCIKGYFTEFIFPGELGPGESDFGAKTIWLVS